MPNPRISPHLLPQSNRTRTRRRCRFLSYSDSAQRYSYPYSAFPNLISYRLPLLLTAFAVLAFSPFRASAYPEFQKYVTQTSGRNVNCAMCHNHKDGPDGLKPGQIGGLTTAQLDDLNKARSAFDPGKEVHSPILNDFGNQIVKQLGRREIMALRPHPEQLPAKLGTKSDLDHDSIPDSQEYSEGTNPLDAQHGNPWLLFKTNLYRSRLHILMITLATISGLYGIGHLLRWLAHATDPKSASASEPATRSKPSPGVAVNALDAID